MPYVPFHQYFPRIAREETRSVTLLDGSGFGLPAGEYGFVEMYCDDPGCDCRRVFLMVLSAERRSADAVIAWGWEPLDFYARWMGDDDSETIAELKGPSLNLGSPQSKYAPALVKLVGDVLLPDSAYVERIKRHYRMFRSKVDGKSGTRPSSRSNKTAGRAKAGKKRRKKRTR